MFRLGLALTAGFLMLTTSVLASEKWTQTLAKAKGQAVYWNAWGGDQRTNVFIDWIGEQVEQRYGIRLNHVKLSDTAEAVTRVVAEKTAGKSSNGSIDLIWINGPNFLSLKEKGLLAGPFAQDLPNARYVDFSLSSPSSVDFTIPVEGFESPWRLAKFVFNYNSARLASPPRTIREFLTWSKNNPGRFTHPVVSNFLGATFLKQALIELVSDPKILQRAATDDNFDQVTAPLWTWYDELRPTLWRQGKTFPASEQAQQQLLADNEIDISMSFDPASAAAAIIDGALPDTIRTYTLANGTLGNISFVAIPFNARNKEGAMVIANFLLEPETQARAQNINILGSFSVLDQSKLNDTQRALFGSLPNSTALPTNAELGITLLEPHPSWMTQLSKAWKKRYTQ
ncbi:MAG: ABC transporter substrate-binding protein [Alphaproteobacteria bacterium]|nr:ABC transporter substrate-binding protein [Alphaproteobacteria bacterium]